MAGKFKKSFILSSLLLCCGLGYSENSPTVVSQGGPLGAVSIGAQNVNDASASTGASKNAGSKASQQSSAQSLNEKQMLLELQKQVKQLQGQLLQIKAQKSSIQNTSNENTQFSTYGRKVYDNKPNSLSGQDLADLASGQNPADIMQNVNAKSSIVDLSDKSLGGVFNPSGGIDVGGAPAITTQGQVTFLGSFSGNNSIPIGQIGSSLFASTLLGQREKFDDYSIFFGGYLEADAQTWFGSSGAGSSGSKPNTVELSPTGQNIYLTAARLYFLANVGHYVTLQFDFDTDESSGFSLGNAFAIFGNLDTSPFFVTVGRNKLSVGSYGGGGTWTNGMTNFLKPGRATNISVNYKSQVWNANVTAFATNDQKADFSTGLFYADSWTEDLIGAFNVGYVYNLNGSGDGSIQNFMKNANQEAKVVGGFNVDGNLTYGLWGGFLNVGAGWSTTTNKDDFNGAGTNVLAGGWYGAANYSMVLGGRNTNFGVSYGQSYNARNISMGLSASAVAGPSSTTGIQRQLLVSAQRAYFDNNVLFGPEYSYQQLYDGKHMNTITLDMSVYV
ncbi:DUF3573 domain-containing protein [Francisella sp. LA112445]|uniref:DUF3573 domain-containing protein n=1 Tax=Francisella sp. LA112445 TaxID=1395624 RepID=UPI001788CCE8|nr:DUF3573 domain-containing protein [Francisella sp. LA112445]QIW09560.1 DUF3573 domain-containing protein [Francisella sp. LA112445]